MRFNLPRLIGITGKAGSGKDTLADYLVRQHEYYKYSLAAPIKKLLNERFGWTDKVWEDREMKERIHPQCGFKGDPHDMQTQLFQGFSPRSWAQWLGTEVGRYLGGENVWVNRMECEWEQLDRAYHMGLSDVSCMVVPDVRFDNEARRIQSLGGVVIRVVRPDATPVAAHVSETGVSDELVNVQVTNDKDVITYLREAVYALEQAPRGS